MRQLTFNGYLKQYVKRLSGLDTHSLYRLADNAKTNHRLRVPLFLFAMCGGKADVLLKAVKDDELSHYYTSLVDQYDFNSLMSALEAKDDLLESSFHKAYNSYVQKRDMPKTYERAKLAMRDRIKQLQNEKGVSNYRLFTDLKLNPGNTNNFLKNGAVSKFSRDTAWRMVEYLEACA